MKDIFWLVPEKLGGRPGPNKAHWSLRALRDGGVGAVLSVNDGLLCHPEDFRAASIAYACIPLSENAPPQSGDDERDLPPEAALRPRHRASVLALAVTIAGATACSGDYRVEYPPNAKFCVVKSYGDQLHPELAASFRESLFASKEEGFTFVPDADCDGAFVISTTYTPDPPASCVSRGQDAAAAGAGFLVVAIVEAACRSFRASRNVVFTEVFVIEKEKGWKVDAKLWEPIERGAPAQAHAAGMAAELARHLAESRAD